LFFQTQPEILHIPSHPNPSDIVLPFRTRLRWYPTCLLKHHCWCRKNTKPSILTLSYFRSLFNHHRRRLFTM